MGDKPTKPVRIKFSVLKEAFMFADFGATEGNYAYIGRRDGKIYFESDDEELNEGIPDDIAESDDYLQLPDKRDLDLGNRLAFNFAADVMPDYYDDVRDMFRGKGAYRRFRDFITRKGKLEAWYEDENEATEAALRDWCEANDIELED
jgi:hypothetical protein